MQSRQPWLLGSLGKGSARDLLLATAIAGGVGYAVTAVAGAYLGHEKYLVFASFWSALYLVVGALAGVQHEASRASRPFTESQHRGTTVRDLTASLALLTAIALGSTAPWWSQAVFAQEGRALALPLIVGAVGYVVIAVLSGVLGGLRSWRIIASITVADALVRVTTFSLAIAMGANVSTIIWIVSLPFAAVAVLSTTLLSSTIRGRYVIEDTLSQLAWNTVRTVGSGAAMGVLITGFPAMLAATTSAPDQLTSSAMFVANLVRSPIIVIAMSLQVFMVQKLRDSSQPKAILTKVGVALVTLGVVATTLGALLGPTVLEAVFGGEYSLNSTLFAILIASSVPTGALFFSGAGLLAANRHGAYVLGWAVAAALSVAALLVFRDEFQSALIAATVAAPTIGLAIHACGLARRKA